MRTTRYSKIAQEPLPEPTAAELMKEAEQEAAVFGQAGNVDRLLQMLRQMDPAKDNLADNEEIQVCTTTSTSASRYDCLRRSYTEHV